MKRMFMNIAADKARGERPSAPRAAFAALVAGAAVAGMTYRVLRS